MTQITTSVLSGLTKFLRSRKAVGNYGPSWSSATSQPSKAKQLKIKERGEERKEKGRDGGEKDGQLRMQYYISFLQVNTHYYSNLH